MITFKQKEYTDDEISKRRGGLIDQALIHILKIRLGFDYNRDVMSHRRSIKSFLMPVRSDSLKKKKSNGPSYVLEYYLKSLDRDLFKRDAEEFFKKNYGFSGGLTDDMLDDAINVLKYLMEEKISDTEFTRRIYNIVSYEKDRTTRR